MDIFQVISLFGGLAMFLYGMRTMGDGLKESSSGTLKKAMESVTNNSFKAFLLGLAVTAIIQSSTATIVITAGLVGAGIITLRQSLGIIIGANVGTTVTGQIIRLLDVESSASGILRLFQPSTLAPIALIFGILCLMGLKIKNAKTIGSIAIGFGILFTGLMNMTAAVNSLSETGVFEGLFSQLGNNPFLGYATGATIAFILQSSSATIGILQAFSLSGKLTFKAVYAVIVGVYLGDCVTTGIVCWIGSKAEQKRVGLVNIIYNLAKSAVVIAGIILFKSIGLLDGLWDMVVNPGKIADANSIFNLGSALILLPFVSVFEKASMTLVKEATQADNPYKDKIESLNHVFFSTPALALKSSYDVLMTIYYAAKNNIDKALSLINDFDEKIFEEIEKEEDNIDLLTDRVSDYLADLSPNLSQADHVQILNEYYKVATEFERLGDHAMNIAEVAKEKNTNGVIFSDQAKKELEIISDLLERILNLTEQSFKKRDFEAASQIEPVEEVVDDLVDVLKENHLGRMAREECTVYAGTNFMDILGNVERISDICSNVGLATITRVHPELANHSHDYMHLLHEGESKAFNQQYEEIHKEYFGRLEAIEKNSNE